MSPSTRITRSASVVLALVGTAAIVAAFAIGMTGWPPARATAATDSTAELLGVEDASATRLASEADLNDKFGESAMVTGTVTTSTLTSRNRLRKDTKHRSSSFAVTSSTKGWSSARCSWYGPGFYGNTMAGGGRLTRSSMVVAHKTLPFGTRVQLVYGGRSVTAVVQDRGPYIAGRVFDLGPGTARALGFSGVGIVKYRIVGR